MAFFEELGRRVSDFGQGVATKTKNFSDVSKLNSAIADLERQIANAYAGIGKAYYEAHKDDPNAEQREGIAYINSAMEQIHQYQEQVKVIRGIVKCPHCGADVSATAPFCSSCGKSTGFAGAKIVCPVCGAQMAPGTAFCTACGNRLPQQAAAQPANAQPPVQPQQPPAERYCPNCHAKLAPGDTFCTNCGAGVAGGR